MAIWAFIVIAAVALFGFGVERQKAIALRRAGAQLHSLPNYYGAVVSSRVFIPGICLLLLWISLEQVALDWLVWTSLPVSVTENLLSAERDLLLNQIRQVANGVVFGTPATEVMLAAERLAHWRYLSGWLLFSCSASISVGCYLLARRRTTPQFRARQAFGRVLDGIMIVSALVAIATTVGIVLSLLFEAQRFFETVGIIEFLTGTRWEPQIPIRADQVTAGGAFGAVGVFVGTILIASIAMAVAVPIGLVSAIYLSEFAPGSVRRIVKPVIEILAGVPTVVYGFFAVIIVAPFLVGTGEVFGLDVAPNSALAAGAVMGIMLIPFISSFSEDALAAVPQTMRDGSYALGATQAETIVSVLLPAALPGIVGGVLLAVSRAIGETMIVVMAAGLIANITANPFEGVTTVTVQIVTLLIGDTEFDNPKTLAAFALGLILFVSTLALNVVALKVVQKYRERYE